MYVRQWAVGVEPDAVLPQARNKSAMRWNKDKRLRKNVHWRHTRSRYCALMHCTGLDKRSAGSNHWFSRWSQIQQPKRIASTFVINIPKMTRFRPPRRRSCSDQIPDWLHNTSLKFLVKRIEAYMWPALWNSLISRRMSSKGTDLSLRSGKWR